MVTKQIKYKRTDHYLGYLLKTREFSHVRDSPKKVLSRIIESNPFKHYGWYLGGMPNFLVRSLFSFYGIKCVCCRKITWPIKRKGLHCFKSPRWVQLAGDLHYFKETRTLHGVSSDLPGSLCRRCRYFVGARIRNNKCNRDSLKEVQLCLIMEITSDLRRVALHHASSRLARDLKIRTN